jgi:hypothetical protein
MGNVFVIRTDIEAMAMSNLPDRIPPFSLLLRAAIMTLLMAWMSGGLGSRQFGSQFQLQSSPSGGRLRLSVSNWQPDLPHFKLPQSPGDRYGL